MLILFCFLLTISIIHVNGHGMMLDPPNRSSLWRFDSNQPVNYNDNQNFCGGFYNQWYIHDGKCGVCGDEYNQAHPQNNENTGKFGNGKIIATYKSGSTITVSILVTANHLGYFEYSLCEIKDKNKPESGESCFKTLTLSDGTTRYKVNAKDKNVTNKIKLPEGLKCEHCVLRWHYNAGNSWGVCEDGTGAMGCGAQENFRSCSDIKIV